MKSNFLIYPLLLAFIFINTACDDEMNETMVTESELTLHFHPMVNGEEFSYDNTYTIDGQSIKFNVVQFYVSNLSLMQEDQTIVSFDGGNDDKQDDLFLLVHPDQMMYQVGKIPAAHYHGLSFQVGVDTVVNSTIEPTAWPADHALSADNPNHAYWSWNSGYLFVRLEGTVNGNDFVYHVGTNKMFTTTGMIEAHSDIMSEQKELMIMYNIGNFLNGVDLSQEANRSTHTFDNSELASQIINNVKSSFSISANDHMSGM